MKMVRAILVALIAISVAALPVASGMARAAMTHDVAVAAKGDCCHEGAPCERKKADDCDSMAGCALKCFNFSSTLMAPLAVMFMPSAMPRLAAAVPGAPSATYNPPLPPPRL